MHFIYKGTVFREIVSDYKISTKKKQIIFCFSAFYFIFMFLILSLTRKTWLTYGYFSFGLVYYMISSVILDTIKKHRFSVRMIIFDCVSIITLSMCNKYYPSWNY